MAASFAAYASQYLNRQQQQQEASMLSSSHPMFFSFSTEGGSRGGHGPDSALLDDYDLDDPHLNLRESGASEATARRPAAGRTAEDEEDDDPYLRLDEDERTGRYGFQSRDRHQKSRLIGSDDQDSSSSESPKGWLAHLAASPSLHMAAATPRPVRSPSPARSSVSDSEPPAGFFGGRNPSRKGRLQQSRLPPPPRTERHNPHSLSLTESLLPRDGRSRPMDVFSLPDHRHLPRGRRKHHDSIWTSAWLAGVTICVVSAIILLFAVRQPKGIPGKVLPYVTLVRTVPLLTILTFVAAAVAYVHIFLLQIFVTPVMIATSVFIPVTLLISALWAFIGSFMWEEGTEPTWGETVGLRLFSIIPLLLAVYTGRKLTNLPNQIHTTSSTLTLVTHLLMMNPFLLALSPAILLAMLLTSLPFLTLIFRLLLVGYATGGPAKSSGWEWHLYAWANWAITGAVAVWLWTWGVARGGMRLVAAGVIGAWYFADPNLPSPPPMSTHTIHSALFRAYDHSLGTIVLSALILTAIRMLTLLTLALQRAPAYLPLRVVAIAMPAIRFIIGWIDGVTTALSKYALVYAGLTGDDFMSSARRSRALTSAVETAVMQRGRRRGFGKEPPLTLLTISPLVLTFPFALITYLFVAHTLGAPHEALGASVLAGGVTALVGLFCVGLVKDTADTLYVCYCIDKDAGERHRDEVFIIFEPDGPAQPANTRNQQRQQQGQQPQSKASQRQQAPSKAAAPAQVGHSPAHGRVPSFSGASKVPLSPFSGPAGGPSSALTASRPQALTESLPGPFSDDEDSTSPRDADLDPFKKSLVDPLGPSQGLADEEDDMYASESTMTRGPVVQQTKAAQPLPVQVTQQQRLAQQQGHHRTGSTGSMGISPPSVSPFMQRNRGFVAGRSPPAAAVGVGLGAAGAGYGFPSSPSRTSEIAKAGKKEERMLTSAELNLKSHVFEGRSQGRLDDSSGSEDGDDHSIDGVSLRGSGGAQVHYGSPFASPRRPEESALEPVDMEEGDVNPFEAAGELEQGLSAKAEPSRDKDSQNMEESDLYPGSGFFN